MVKKKKILYHSDFALSKTGFGRNTKAILSYLYKTGKYEIISLGGGLTKNNTELERTPWKSYGCYPTSGPELEEANSHPDKGRLYSYGALELDKIIEKEKPDIYIGVQDFWGVDYAINKTWFNRLNHVLWVTLDSLPLLPSAVAAAPKIKNYWVWSNFAEKEMHKLGHTHVQTVHGAIDVSEFKPFSKEEKAALRKNNGIDQDNFIIGFVFRNQLRKSVPNLLQGFKSFKSQNPNSKPKLLLHTHWKEGWGIEKLCKEVGVDMGDILTTYICKKCRSYHVRNFEGHDADCHRCKTKDSCVTTSTSLGTTEKQLNEIYNLMDVYCHPFTSGGQEIPIQEAKLTGLITLVTNYSCGEEMCEPEAASIPLAWSEYREFGTEFIKASTCPVSIANNLKLAYEMPDDRKAKMGKQARKWVIDNFSVTSVGEKIEKFLDSCDFKEYSLEKDPVKSCNPNADIPEAEDNILWLKSLYSLILSKEVLDDDEGLLHWIEKIKAGTSRQTIDQYFREVAYKENDKNKSFKLEDLFGDTKSEDRIFVSINSTIENIFLSTKIISAIKEKYPDKHIFVSSNENSQPIFSGNTLIKEAFVQTKQFSDPEFLKNNFYESYCLDNFSINNHHSVLIK
jgi:glycosyltransferase involved in cell wall biosynthesis